MPDNIECPDQLPKRRFEFIPWVGILRLPGTTRFDAETVASGKAPKKLKLSLRRMPGNQDFFCSGNP